MDIGKFKASRGRLIAWVLIPPALIVGIGLSSFALKLQSEWQLERTRVLSELLPQVKQAELEVQSLLTLFNESAAGSIKSEDELISFLQNTARDADFTVDSLQVERRSSASDKKTSVLTAKVRGSGTFVAVQSFMGDAASRQHLLSESSLQISQGGERENRETCRADITFELILFNAGKLGGGA